MDRRVWNCRPDGGRIDGAVSSARLGEAARATGAPPLSRSKDVARELNDPSGRFHCPGANNVVLLEQRSANGASMAPPPQGPRNANAMPEPVPTLGQPTRPGRP